MTFSLIDDCIQCIADEQLEGSVIIEQQIIKKGTDELFILKKVNQPHIQCKNGIEIHVEEKLKVKISLRQVSHIKKVTNGLSFFFSAFVNNKLDACYEIEIEKVKVSKCKFLMDFHLNF